MNGSTKLQVLIGTQLEVHHHQALESEFPETQFIPGLTDEAMLRVAPDVDVIFTKRLPRSVVQAAARLRWIHMGTAGVNAVMYPEVLERKLILTNSRGAHGVPIAENILAMALAFAVRLNVLIRAQTEQKYAAKDVFPTKFELEGQTLLIIGLGDIGGTLAKKAKALGCRVTGLRRSPRPFPGLDAQYTHDQLEQALGEADHVALCLPLTAETKGFIGAREFQAMKSSAYIYNVGRGESIDRAALISALEEGRIAGAGLDVTSPEPMEAGDPLWNFPNVILTQHTSGSSPKNADRITEIFTANLRRFVKGEELTNRVDLSLGY